MIGGTILKHRSVHPDYWTNNLVLDWSVMIWFHRFGIHHHQRLWEAATFGHGEIVIYKDKSLDRQLILTRKNFKWALYSYSENVNFVYFPFSLLLTCNAWWCLDFFSYIEVIFGENFIFEFLNDFQIYYYSFDAIRFISNESFRKLNDSLYHF